MSKHVFKRFAERLDTRDENRKVWEAQAESILRGCHDKQQPFVLDMSTWCSLICPRRSGKTVAMLSKALRYMVLHPNSRVLIISLTLKSTRENYWSGAPHGLFRMNLLHGLNLKFNHTDSTFIHANGSRGRLAGAETRADIEYLRGAAAEADIAIVDECKSFAPDLLQELIRDVLEPGLMTRKGQLVLGGTPGNIRQGPFWEATDPHARTKPEDDEKEGKITCIPSGATGPLYDDLPEAERKALWSLHSWTIQDNTKAPDQWERALRNKRRAGWSDDNPIWQREYLGRWVTDSSALVYSFLACKTNRPDSVTWVPARRSKENRTGLPQDKGPWHLVMGLDFGFEDDNALVLAGYSETSQELRHVYDFKAPHMTSDEFAGEILAAIDKYGQPEAIVGDVGGLGKLLVETLNQRYGLGILPAEKREKFDHIELLNSDFHEGRVLIIPGSDLDHELCGLQYDLDQPVSMEILARLGKLRESPKTPNHLCDCLLYLWRYCYHYWATPRHVGPSKGTDEWLLDQERRTQERLAQKRASQDDPLGLRRLRAQATALRRENLNYTIPRSRN